MDIFLMTIIQIYVLLAFVSVNKSPTFWNSKQYGGFLWIKMTTFKRKKILKYLFYNEKVLDKRTLRVPVWSLILKSNFYINIIVLIITILFFTEYLSIIQFFCILFTVSSTEVCLFIVPLIEYIIWKFFIHEDKYIEKFIILKIFFLYIIFQTCAIFVSIFNFNCL